MRVAVGDDCAVIGGPKDAHWQLLKTDAVVEGVHFVAGEAMERVGWKAVCRTFSDIAAMGGQPEHVLVTLALPPRMEVTRIKAFYRGIRKACRRFGAAVVGGETSRSPGVFFCSIAATGSVARTRCTLRSGGKPGDALYVTGRLGGSLASGKHLDFLPRLAEAHWLTSNFPLHAMMDLSDGLGADLPRLAAASGCAFQLETECVPRTPGCSLQAALGDGEDFELLFALHPHHGRSLEVAWRGKFPRLPLTRIGSLVPRTRRATRIQVTHGYDHFA